MWRLVLHQAIVLALVLSTPAIAEMVEVRGRGQVNLQAFVCEFIPTPKSAVRRVCYDELNRYMVVLFGGSVYLQYCDVEAYKVYGIIHADRPSKYFADEIRRRYSCEGGNTSKYFRSGYAGEAAKNDSSVPSGERELVRTG